jgi:hypothetical protein
MRKITLTITLFLSIYGVISAQQEKGIVGVTNWLNNWTQFKPNQEYYGEPTQILTGDITEDTKLYKRHVYLLEGDVFVSNNATLSIEPGTIILGDYKTKASLTISRGATIIADGSETDPIIFTSNRSLRRSGDWGGLIILGDAPTNKFGNGSVASFYGQLKSATYGNTNFGGENPNSSSGILRFVRIEYAGKRTVEVGNFNGLLLASVGKETVLENIMVSYSAGNSFEIWGGQVDLFKVVSYRSNGNDFSFNYGTQCIIDNSLAVRSPYASNSNGSRSLQIKTYNEQNEVDFTRNPTSVVAKNLTLLNDSEDLKSHISSGLINEAVYVGHNASLDMNKSVISGFNPAVIFEDKITLNQENLERIKFTSMYFNNCNGNIFLENNSNNEDLEDWYGNNAFSNVYSKSSNTETFIKLDDLRRPDFRLRINGIIATRN